jgi:pimeloyl-ACP methyl ester carboxylesterase
MNSLYIWQFVVPGTPSEENCYGDISAVFHYLTTERKVPIEHIVLMGRSLGSGPTCYLAAKCANEGKHIAGVILVSPFTSVYRLLLPDIFGSLPGDCFVNIDRIRDIRAPILFAHGEADHIVPIQHSQALRDALPRRNVEFFTHPDMTHNDIDEDIEEEMLASMNDFLDYYVLARRLWMKPSIARLHVCK